MVRFEFLKTIIDCEKNEKAYVMIIRWYIAIVKRITDVALIVESCSVFYFMYFVWQFYKQNAKALVFSFYFCVDSSNCNTFGVTEQVFSFAH